ncbi:hypothetical protein U5817_24825 [Aromatoleum evansii]|uniref:Uncharacterized protein n=1 Tax=Aromatoleum evansii TaxID=59406 RepID=A0ABZ1AKJ3_AROEV|nr:hypothetical protein U5817_24825 [Aromatoleum evansii]
MNAADLHIGRVVLRGTAPAIEHARRQLPATLARAHWPADDAIVVIRRVAVGGTATELPARAAAAAEHLVRRAADPWSPAADAAEAVRFRDALDYRACLVRDLLKGTAAHRWLWHHRAALLARPTAEALAELLAEDALALPTLLDRPALRDSLPALWRTLDARAAHEVLRAIGSATGWQAAITAAQDPTPHERRAEKRSAFRRMSNGGIGEAAFPPSLLHAAAQWPSAPFGSSALRSLQSLPNDLPPSDPRVVLQAVLAMWTHTPAILAGTDAGDALRATTETFVRPTPASEPATASSRAPQRTAAETVVEAGEPTSDPTETGAPRIASPKQDASQRATPPAPTANAKIHGNLAADAPSDAPPTAPSRVSSTAASPAVLPPAADVDFHTRGGGFFFLLNVLNLPALRDWRATLAEPHAGWRELLRLALRLDFTPDAPLAAFLADACALNLDVRPDDDPVAALAALPPGADPAPVHHAALRHYGDTALAAALAERPAHVRATASHLDVHLRLNEIHLDIRRCGLDLDPGWLPWLGCVVRFHYDSGGIPR